MSDTNSFGQAAPLSETSSNQPERPSRRRLGLRLLLYFAIFVCGGAVGVGSTLLVVRAQAMRAVHYPERMPEVIAAALQSRLGLDDEQTRQVTTILQERQRALQEIRRQYQPQVEAELDEVDRQITEVLHDDQRTSWKRLYQHLRGTWVPPMPES